MFNHYAGRGERGGGGEGGGEGGGGEVQKLKRSHLYYETISYHYTHSHSCTYERRAVQIRISLDKRS